jgi:hypothetical protein
VLVLSDITQLFDLPAPAATFSSPFAWPFNPKPNALRNPYGRMRHGERVPFEAIEVGFQRSFVATGTTVLLETSRRDFDGLIDMLNVKKPFGFRSCYSGMDEQSIVYLYQQLGRRFTYIHQRHNFIPWNKAWIDPDKDGPPTLFHFFGTEKPWVGVRSDWPDVESWWQMAQVLVEAHPNLRDPWFAVAPGKLSVLTDKLKSLAITPALVDAPSNFDLPRATNCHYCRSMGYADAERHTVFATDGSLTCPKLQEHPRV